MKRLINAIILISYMLLCLFLLFLFKDILDKKEMIFLIGFFILLEFILIYLLKKNVLLFFSYPCIIILLIFLFGFGLKTSTVFKFVNEVVTENNIIDNYRVLVLKNKYKNIDELQNKKIGYTIDTTGFNHLEINFDAKCYQNFDEMIKALDEKKIDAAIILSSQYENLSEEKYEIIYKFLFNEEIIPTSKEVDSNINLIYISSIDQGLTGKSDVNLILGINNNTKQILFISIPKDYYVLLASKGEKDRISHAGIYGINESMKTIENLLKNKIDYYIKIDINNIAALVDKIGGIEVESESDFVSASTSFKKGINKLNGNEALIFARDIKGFTSNNTLNNTEKVIESLLSKIVSNNYFLNNLNELKLIIKTNIPEKNILKLIKDKVTYDYKYNKVKYTLTGTNTFNYTYSYKCCKLNVIEPDMISVNEAITLIEYLKTDGIFN